MHGDLAFAVARQRQAELLAEAQRAHAIRLDGATPTATVTTGRRLRRRSAGPKGDRAMTPGSRGAAASGLALPCLLAAALLALSAGCSSDQHAEAATTASSTHTTDPSDTTETTTKASADSGAGDGIIAGEPFTAGTQLVQWDALSNAWRLHILSGEHSCAEDLGGLRPSVGIDFQGPTESAVTVPPAGTFTEGVGVVFRPADPDASFGPLTTTTGVTLGLELTISQPGEHWKGRLSVDGFQPDGTAYGFDGPIDAEVCEPVTG